MCDKKSPRAVSTYQNSTAQKPQEAANDDDAMKDTTAVPFCLLGGETYTEQAANQKAREIEARARAWIDANSTLWSCWASDVRDAVRERSPWSMKHLAAVARFSDRVNDTGEPFKINDNLISALVRIMCEEVDGAAELVIVRRSIFERAREERNEA